MTIIRHSHSVSSQMRMQPCPLQERKCKHSNAEGEAKSSLPAAHHRCSQSLPLPTHNTITIRSTTQCKLREKLLRLVIGAYLDGTQKRPISTQFDTWQTHSSRYFQGQQHRMSAPRNERNREKKAGRSGRLQYASHLPAFKPAAAAKLHPKHWRVVLHQSTPHQFNRHESSEKRWFNKTGSGRNVREIQKARNSDRFQLLIAIAVPRLRRHDRTLPLT